MPVLRYLTMHRLFLLAFGAVSLTVTKGQLAIPPRELGFVHGYGQPGAQVKLAYYIDLICPESKAAFQTLLSVIGYYHPNQVQLKTHLFPVVSNRNSYVLSKAAHVLNSYNSPLKATVYDWLTTVYNNIDSLSTAANVDKTDVDVINYVAALAQNVSGISPHEFKAGVSSPEIDSATILEWKYGITRNVYKVPLFTVNDVFVNANHTWTVAQWLELLNSIVYHDKGVNVS